MTAGESAIVLDVELESGPEAAREARNLILASLGQRLPERALFDAVLLVSELVTNSYRHGAGGSIGMKAMLMDDCLRVEVTDPGGGGTRPVLREPSLGGGWGLRILDRVAERWGTMAGPPRTLVWFELPTDEDRPGAGRQPG